MSLPPNISPHQSRVGQQSVNKSVSHHNVSTITSNESALARTLAKINEQKKALEAAKSNARAAFEEATVSTLPRHDCNSMDRLNDTTAKSDGKFAIVSISNVSYFGSC